MTEHNTTSRRKGRNGQAATGAQQVRDPVAQVFAGWHGQESWSRRKGDYRTYRLMRRHPTLALAISLVKSPIISNTWSYEAPEDTEVNPQWIEFVKNSFDPQRVRIVVDALRSLDYGFAAFEKVYRSDGQRVVLDRLKWLMPDLTDLQVDPNGRFAGIRQGDVALSDQQVIIFSNSHEGDNYYGESRFENVRDVWNNWMTTARQAGDYHRKVANIIPRIHYPLGESKDMGGATRSNYVMAQQLIQAIMDGKGVVIPNLWLSSNDPMMNAELAGKSPWVIDFVESGATDFSRGFVEYMRYLDSLLFRGLLRPERTGLEGQHGTRAEAGEHADAAILDCEQIDSDLAEVLNRGVVDDLLVLNFGAQARGMVRIRPAPIADQKIQVFRNLVDAFVRNPRAVDRLYALADMPQVLQQLDIPMRDGAMQTDDADEADEPEAGDDPAGGDDEGMEEQAADVPVDDEVAAEKE